MFAAMYGRNNVLELLLEKGADPHLTDRDGSAPSDIVSQQSNLKAIALLSPYCS
jgi:hypothetical protein